MTIPLDVLSDVCPDLNTVSRDTTNILLAYANDMEADMEGVLSAYAEYARIVGMPKNNRFARVKNAIAKACAEFERLAVQC